MLKSYKYKYLAKASCATEVELERANFEDASTLVKVLPNSENFSTQYTGICNNDRLISTDITDKDIDLAVNQVLDFFKVLTPGAEYDRLLCKMSYRGVSYLIRFYNPKVPVFTLEDYIVAVLLIYYMMISYYSDNNMSSMTKAIQGLFIDYVSSKWDDSRYLEVFLDNIV